MDQIKIGKYKHYKTRQLYEVIATAVLEENLTTQVIYKQLYDLEDFKQGQLWIRPIDNFLENVNFEGKLVPRFEFVED